ncbi:hypothetical protein [Lysobacter sp. Root690]|nr:hypothetical protein [Lysobacter sp. Root690]
MSHLDRVENATNMLVRDDILSDEAGDGRDGTGVAAKYPGLDWRHRGF